MKLNKIYNEDCLETMSRMEDNFLDLTVTSPPYDNLRTYNDNIDETWGEHVWKPIIKELYRVTKQGGVVVWVVGDATIDFCETGTSFRQALYGMECGFNLLDTMIYAKKSYAPAYPNMKRYAQTFEYMFVFSKKNPITYNPVQIKKTKSSIKRKKINTAFRQKDGSFNRKKINSSKEYKDKSNVWVFDVGGSKSSLDDISYNHPATYPEKLARDHIYSWSNKGDIVYDPFMGSGTTAKMAHLQNRKWIGSEISKEYVELAYKRLKPYLSQTQLF